MANNEQAIIDAMRAHDGGLGGALTKEKKMEIICGQQNKSEKVGPVDGRLLQKGFKTAMKNHPVEWFLE